MRSRSNTLRCFLASRSVATPEAKGLALRAAADRYNRAHRLALSPDESFVTIVGVVIGPVLWAVWLFRLSRVQMLRRRPVGVNAIGLALAACAGLLFAVLKTSASFDVVDAPVYLFMYVVLGLAWLRAVELIFAFLGLSIRDDVVERSNRAAVPAVVGGMIAVTLCYAGGNIGDGPG